MQLRSATRFATRAGPCRLAAPVAVRSREVHCQAVTAGSGKVEALRHITEDGWGLELLLQRAEVDKGYPPLLFVHGSYHGAWCWAENFLPYFAERGYNCYAVSLKAQGNSDCIGRDTTNPIQVAGTLDTHAADLADLISNFPQPPVVVAHSFGGLILQKYVQLLPQGKIPQLEGTAFLASVPPSGNKTMIGRMFVRQPLLSLRTTWGFIAKSFSKDAKACREMFFSDDLSAADLAKYQQQLAACSPVRLIDLNDVTRQVPFPPPPPGSPPAFVLGAENDKVVDVEAIEELAQVYGTKAVILPNMAHDVMLDTRWEQTASELSTWLQTLPAKK